MSVKVMVGVTNGLQRMFGLAVRADNENHLTGSGERD
jgi:hypothetical protein